MAAKIAFIIGSGPRTGASIVSAFASKGYKIAVASRRVEEGLNDEGHLRVKLDLSDPSTVKGAFAKVKTTFGNAPNVVVYNAASHTILNGADLLATLSIDDITRDLNVNTVSTTVAAQAAVAGFQELPDTLKKTFIFTGNALPVLSLPRGLTMGMGKTATWHLIEGLTNAYGKRNYRFYFADERTADGSPVYAAIDGPAHGEAYTELAEVETQQPWFYTFVKGQGYADFQRKP